MESKVYTKLWEKLLEMHMTDRAEVIPCRFGYEYVAVSCNNRFEREVVTDVVRGIKGAMIETFFPGVHDSIGVVKVHDGKSYAETRKKIDEEMKAVDNWWMRYHEADDETKKLMACGKVQ